MSRLTPEQVTELLEEGRKAAEEFNKRWKRSQRSETEILRDRIEALEARVRALEEKS